MMVSVYLHDFFTLSQTSLLLWKKNHFFLLFVTLSDFLCLFLLFHFPSYIQISMTQDQKDDQKAFQVKQRELLMASKDLSQHAIAADTTHLEESLQRGIKKLKTVPSSISVPVTVSAEDAPPKGTNMTPSTKKNKNDGSEKKRKFSTDGGSHKKSKE